MNELQFTKSVPLEQIEQCGRAYELMDLYAQECCHQTVKLSESFSDYTLNDIPNDDTIINLTPENHEFGDDNGEYEIVDPHSDKVFKHSLSLFYNNTIK